MLLTVHARTSSHAHITLVHEPRNQIAASWLSHVLLYARGGLSAPEQRRGDVSREQHEAEEYVAWVNDEQLCLQTPLLYKVRKYKVLAFCPPTSLLPCNFLSILLWICNLKLLQCFPYLRNLSWLLNNRAVSSTEERGMLTSQVQRLGLSGLHCT